MEHEQPTLEFMPEKPKRHDPPKQEIKGVQYRRYKVKNLVIHCDACVADIAAKWGKEPTHAPNRAAFRRITKGSETLLCFQHAEEARQKDGL
jgi:hypothetical protein